MHIQTKIFQINREVIIMKKLLAVLMALTLVLAFAACTKQPADTGDETQKTLIMGTNAAFPPYEFVADDGSFAGIDVEIAQAVAEKLGMKLSDDVMQYNHIDWTEWTVGEEE